MDVTVDLGGTEMVETEVRVATSVRLSPVDLNQSSHVLIEWKALQIGIHVHRASRHNLNSLKCRSVSLT